MRNPVTGVTLRLRLSSAFWGLIALIPIEFLYLVSRVRIYHIVLFAIAAFWLANLLIRDSRVRLTPTGKYVALYFVGGLPSLANTPSLRDSIDIILATSALVVLFFVAVSIVVSQARLERFLTLNVYVSSAIAIVALFQYLFQKLLGLSFTFAESQSRFLRHTMARPSGTFLEPNWLAAYLVFGGIFALAWSRQRTGTRSWVLRSFAIIHFSVIVLTNTRSAFIGIVLGLLANYLTMPGLKTKLRYSIVLGMILLISLSFAYTVNPRLLSFLSPSANPVGIEARLNSWDLALTRVREHPWIGNGVGSYAYYLRKSDQALIIKGRIVPNIILNQWFEAGVLGMIPLVLLLSHLVVILIRSGRSRPKFESSILVHASSAALLGQVGAFLFTNAIRYGFFWLNLGLVAAGYAIMRRQIGHYGLRGDPKQ